ncbi:MAG: hypothetical protein CMC75_04295 [Flavobacteriaceae bacterium]|nr:hypothetical protein [Flavobacteriaceae bacterium]|tara:strand:+ start:74 stop:421 length:348 start_codon:yes stop_codon:yes gene_type:complete
MCEKCFQSGIYSFKSYDEFKEFERLIDQKIRGGVITGIGERNELNFYNLTYHCSNCNEIWFLSDPDNSWRGYFLTKNQAIDYENKIDREGKIRARGCMIGFVLLILLIIYLVASA